LPSKLLVLLRLTLPGEFLDSRDMEFGKNRLNYKFFSSYAFQNFNPDYALEIVMKLSNAIKTRVSG
jgi:hypothetical protein